MITVEVTYGDLRVFVDMGGPAGNPDVEWDSMFAMIKVDEPLYEWVDISSSFRFSDNKRFAPVKAALLRQYQIDRRGDNKTYDDGEAS